ncbi:hypothetical protein J3Q64DRAFT_1832644 [Phycomyces blakesleeanus]|uniref:LIM zinc-binding domain-containing protein n=1 Tax=Phycomyces blakesleeanus TaxID=4837 RepID=A0ABR3B3E9_PHYBL
MSKVAPNERMSQILPTVKCSDCGRDVHIRRLGDHLCSSAPPLPTLPIIPIFRNDQSKPGPIKSPAKSPPPSSPLSSPNNFKYDNNYGNNYSSEMVGSVTPPYYPGMARDLRRPSAYEDTHQRTQQPLRARSPLDNYHDDGSGNYRPNNTSNTSINSLRAGNLPNQNPGSLSSHYNNSLPYDQRNNNQSPVRTEDNSPKSPPFRSDPSRSNNGSRDDIGSGYHGDDRYKPGEPLSPRTRKESLGNILSGNKNKSGSVKAGGGALDSLMADLMNSMQDINDDEGIGATGTDNSCSACHEEFDYRDDVTTVGNKASRASNVDSVGLLLILIKIHLNMKATFTVNAIIIDRPIQPGTKSIKALGKYYHPGHLKCYHCYEPVDEKTGCKEHQGRVYCRADFKTLFLPKCRGCNKPVEKEAVSALDGKLQGKWHLDCFGCHTCHRPFPDNTFYVFENAPYCKRHYHQLNNSLCRTCDDPIEGPCAQTIENWRFHPPCFRCHVCRCPITDVYYMLERHIYCEEHIQQLQRQRNIRAEKRRTQFGQV